MPLSLAFTHRPLLLAVTLSLVGCGSSDSDGAGGEGGFGKTTSAGETTSASSATAGQGGASVSSSDAASSTTAGSGGSGGGATSGAGGSGGASSDDPCSAAADGAHCGSELGGLADHASQYVCSGGVTASATPCPNGCSGGACVPAPADPCASAQSGNGAYCGGSLSGGDPSSLYHCANGATSSTDFCPAGCQVQPPGVADNCKPSGDPCVNANGGNGAYCGGSLGSGDPNVLYDCQNGATASQTTCAAGCQMNPPGQADVCSSVGGGQCCIGKPPGVLTQSYSACGNGGSHYGIDLGTPVGTPIYAPMSGTVVGSALGFPNCYNNGCSQACWNAFNYVKLKADCGDPAGGSNDFYVYYLHINALGPGISNGVHVDQGQHLADSGNSGCSSGPHIHIESVSVAPGAGASLSTCNSVDPAGRYCP